MTCHQCGARLYDDRVEVREMFNVIDVESHQVIKASKKFIAFCDDMCVEEHYWSPDTSTTRTTISYPLG